MLMNCRVRSNLTEEEGEGNSSTSGEWVRPCESCQSAPSAVYCRADAAYLCAGCDTRMHAANRVASRHERVWVCEACERAPATVTCRADAAVLCAACDMQVHSANPLARRHHRVPIFPLPAGPIGAAVPVSGLPDTEPWLPLDESCNRAESGFLIGGEVDEYLDFVEYNSCYESKNQEQQFGQQNEGSEFVVPSQQMITEEQHQLQKYEASNAGFSYTASLSHSVSFSSMEASIVPDTSMTDISNSNIGPLEGTTNHLPGPSFHLPPQFSSVDREARVLRYREKRKTRKFEKTIRYASRKAYAEARPRIKGRFAKRSDIEHEVDQMFAATEMSDGNYGIVPSF
ncbi:zinc finger protein HD1-like [Typha latifolia]|uniref:zinc finger protein HD1-like n=1 Tax=Typha latifolia TaxID=4733 RepID=UPI003C2F119F